jgi:hypothetical protein
MYIASYIMSNKGPATGHNYFLILSHDFVVSGLIVHFTVNPHAMMQNGTPLWAASGFSSLTDSLHF